MTVHAQHGASNAERWINCPGSVRAEEGRVDTGSVWAHEGTAAHTLASRCFERNTAPEKWLGEEIEVFLEDGSSVLIEVTEEMCDAVSIYLNECRVCAVGADIVWVEQKFDLAPFKPDAPIFGTADFVAYFKEAGILHVKDLKYGKGVAVTAEQNAQMRVYALGAWVELLLHNRADAERLTTIVTSIIQPRMEDGDGEPSITFDEIPLSELKAWGRELLEAVRRTLQPYAPRYAGKWCQFCKAKADCPTFRSVGLAIAQLEFSDVAEDTSPTPPSPADMTPEQVARVLEHKDMLEGWLAAVEARAFNDLEQGREVPGWALKPKRANRRWTSENEVVDWVVDELGERRQDVFTEPKLISPAQMEKLLGKKAKLPPRLVFSRSSGYTLTRSTDPKAVTLGANEFPSLTDSTKGST